MLTIKFFVMKTLLKNLNFGALVALTMVVTLTVSWKNHESKRLTFQWFEVSDNGSGNTNKVIVGDYPGGQPGAECEQPEGDMCAVPIDRQSYTGPINTLAHAYQLQTEGKILVGEPVYREEE